VGGLFGIGGHRPLKPLWSGPLLANNRLILVSSRGQLTSLNAKTGATERTISIGAPSLVTPIAMGGMIYVVTDNAQLVALR
jgi:outer membrane protein assembly factor BamB